MEPEKAHKWTMALLTFLVGIPGIKGLFRRMFHPKSASQERVIWGIRFRNPVGIAAGFDKNARYVDILEGLGFGFVEIGTVTPRPQPGNPQPRLFRLPADKALINRMGFNNEGAAAAARRLRTRKGKIVVGGNIGKNKTTPNEQATADYEAAFLALKDVVDYFVINVSSPNTPGLRDLQDKKPLLEIIRHLQRLNKSENVHKPILLKIAPDLTDSQIDDIVDILEITKLDGLITTNTTISRANLTTPEADVEACGNGGLSGKPIFDRSTEILKYIHKKTEGKTPIIASGGIFTAEDAQKKLDAGASLVQVYTGFIYEGPFIVKNICNGLK